MIAQTISLLGLTGAIFYSATSGAAVTSQDAFSALFNGLELKQCSTVAEISTKDCELAKAWILETSFRLYMAKNFQTLNKRIFENPGPNRKEPLADGTIDGFFTIEMDRFAECMTASYRYVLKLGDESEARYWMNYVDQAQKFFYCAHKINEKYALSGAKRRTAFVYRKILSIRGGIEGGVINPGSTCGASKTNPAILRFAVWKIPNLIVR